MALPEKKGLIGRLKTFEDCVKGGIKLKDSNPLNRDSRRSVMLSKTLQQRTGNCGKLLFSGQEKLSRKRDLKHNRKHMTGVIVNQQQLPFNAPTAQNSADQTKAWLHIEEPAHGVAS